MEPDKYGSNRYVTAWFDQIVRSPAPSKPYWEPLITDSIARFIKTACECLKQDTHVFVSVVETLERYAGVKIALGAPLEDMTLVAVCGVFLCSKYAGGQSDLRASYIEEYLNRTVVYARYSTKTIINQEFDIFRTLNGTVPLHTPLDDLNILLENYVTALNLKADLHELCTAILELFYVYRNRIFAELKGTYQKTNKGFYAFTQCVRQPLYFPSGILLCAFKVTKCASFLDLERIGKDLGRLTCVHEDHLQFLCDVIYDVVVHDDV